MKKTNQISTEFSQDFLQQVKSIIGNAQNNVIRSINSERVLMYWKIGERIVVEEQSGYKRANYGSYLIKILSKELTATYGSGFSYRQLNFCRQFFIIFPKVNALRSQLNWTQYRLLIRIDDRDKRIYYIVSARKRQILRYTNIY